MNKYKTEAVWFVFKSICYEIFTNFPKKNWWWGENRKEPSMITTNCVVRGVEVDQCVIHDLGLDGVYEVNDDDRRGDAAVLEADDRTVLARLRQLKRKEAPSRQVRSGHEVIQQHAFSETPRDPTYVPATLHRINGY